MNFDYSPKVQAYRERLLAFFEQHIYPNEPRFHEEVDANRRAGNAWVTDATYAITMNSSTDYKLLVTLRGGLVNVAVNGAVVLSKLFAETTTMGGYGLISRKGASSGASSFDIVQISSDERDYAPATPLLQSAAPLNAEPARPLDATPTAADLAGLLAEAQRRWAGAGLDAAALARIQAASVALADLPGGELGQEVAGTVYVDRDAAGLGWFVDATPGDDAEFRLAQHGGRARASTRHAADHGIDTIFLELLRELGDGLFFITAVRAAELTPTHKFDAGEL